MPLSLCAEPNHFHLSVWVLMTTTPITPTPIHPLCAIMTQMRSEDAATRRSALTSIRRLTQTASAETLPILIEVATVPDPDVQTAAAEAMQHLEPKALPEMLKAMKDPRAAVRHVVVQGMHGRKDQAALIIPARSKG